MPVWCLWNSIVESVRMIRVFSQILLICAQFSRLFSYNILGVFPVRAYSHFTVMNSIALELAKGGHNVTVYSRYSSTFEIENYKHVELKDCFPLKNENSKYNSVEYISGYSGILGFILYVLNFIPSHDDIQSCKPLMDLINTTDKYDLLLLEAYNGNTDIYVGLSYKLKAPFIGVSTTMLYPWLSQRVGTPDNPSYIPVPFTGFTSQMNFFERIANTITYSISKIIYDLMSVPESEKVARKLFGEEMPPLSDLLSNCSLMFTYTHSSISPVRPLVPDVVEIAGTHIRGHSELPKDMDIFMNESESGVVYFSMGSFIHSRLFPQDKLDAFLYAFSKIEQRIVWKWEGDPMTVKSSKTFAAAWMPQKDILAHPKVKLFISHGGLLGINEAIHAGVPILGIPIFADQTTNIKYLKELGAGELLNYQEITKETVFEKISKILNNSSYSNNAKELSRRYRDRPLSPQKAVTYWTEYVVKHRGAHHLRSAAMRMPFYQYLLLDVLSCFIFILIATYFITFYVFKSLLTIISKLCKKAVVTTQKKKKD